MSQYRVALSGAIIAAVIMLPILVFSVARALNEGEIAPNVSAGEVPIGGLSPEDALTAMQEHETLLRETKAPFTVNGQDFELDPRIVGTSIDEQAAVDAAVGLRKEGDFFDQFAAWVRSFRSPEVIEVPVSFDERAITSVLDNWQETAIGNPAHQGGVTVEAGVAVPDYPVSGIGIDRVAAEGLIVASLQTSERVPTDLPVTDLIPKITDADVDEAVIEANRILDGTVVLAASQPEVTIEFPPEVLATALRSNVVENSPATLELSLDPEVIAPVVEPFRADIEQPAKSAQFKVGENGVVSIEESRDETKLNSELVAQRLLEVAAGPDTGDFPFEIGEEPAFTTEEARAMGPIRRVSSYTTEYTPAPRATNIQTMAAAVDGAVVWPGETFSLNGYVGERTEEKGYVSAPMILEGDFVDDVGGGVSQFATTFYNAVFFGCYEDVSHRPHSYYFSRYPEGREATISWPSPDLQFHNNSDAVIIIDTYASSTAVTVTFYGNNGGKECSSSLSDRYDETEPTIQYETDTSISPGVESVVQGGSNGWTVDVTRTITSADGSTTEQTWTHRYLAQPTIIRLHPCSVPDSGVPCPVAVPNVIGLTFGEATARLDESGFKIGDGGTTAVTSEGQDGLVQSQSTSGGSYATPGDVIFVTVGDYTAPATTTQPPDTTKPTDTTVPPDTTTTAPPKGDG